MLASQWNVCVAENVSLAWNPSTDSDVAGYRIYYGTASGHYSGVVTVGNTNAATITGFTAGITYYFAATSYDSAGVESDLSNEASYTVPFTQLALTSAISSATQFRFTVSGAAGQLYAVQASTNLTDWTTVQINAAPFTFADTNTAAFPRRFFRAVSW